MIVAYVPSHFLIFDWNLIKQIYYKKFFIKDSFQRFKNTLGAPSTGYFWKTIYCFTQKTHVFEYVIKNKPFSIYVGKP